MKVTVSVHLGCCNRTPQTEWLINNRRLFLPALEAGKSMINIPADLLAGENPLPGSWMALYAASSCSRRGEGTL